MKNQALFSSKDKSKKLKCRLLQFLFGALRVKSVYQYFFLPLNIQLTLVTSNTDISKYPLMSKNIVRMCFLFFFTLKSSWLKLLDLKVNILGLETTQRLVV